MKLTSNQQDVVNRYIILRFRVPLMLRANAASKAPVIARARKAIVFREQLHVVSGTNRAPCSLARISLPALEISHR